MLTVLKRLAASSLIKRQNISFQHGLKRQFAEDKLKKNQFKLHYPKLRLPNKPPKIKYIDSSLYFIPLEGPDLFAPLVKILQSQPNPILTSKVPKKDPIFQLWLLSLLGSKMAYETFRERLEFLMLDKGHIFDSYTSRFTEKGYVNATFKVPQDVISLKTMEEMAISAMNQIDIELLAKNDPNFENLAGVYTLLNMIYLNDVSNLKNQKAWFENISLVHDWLPPTQIQKLSKEEKNAHFTQVNRFLDSKLNCFNLYANRFFFFHATLIQRWKEEEGYLKLDSNQDLSLIPEGQQKLALLKTFDQFLTVTFNTVDCRKMDNTFRKKWLMMLICSLTRFTKIARRETQKISGHILNHIIEPSLDTFFNENFHQKIGPDQTVSLTLKNKEPIFYRIWYEFSRYLNGFLHVSFCTIKENILEKWMVFLNLMMEGLDSKGRILKLRTLIYSSVFCCLPLKYSTETLKSLSECLETDFNNILKYLRVKKVLLASFLFRTINTFLKKLFLNAPSKKIVLPGGEEFQISHISQETFKEQLAEFIQEEQNFFSHFENILMKFCIRQELESKRLGSDYEFKTYRDLYTCLQFYLKVLENPSFIILEEDQKKERLDFIKSLQHKVGQELKREFDKNIKIKNSSPSPGMVLNDDYLEKQISLTKIEPFLLWPDSVVENPTNPGNHLIVEYDGTIHWKISTPVNSVVGVNHEYYPSSELAPLTYLRNMAFLAFDQPTFIFSNRNIQFGSWHELYEETVKNPSTLKDIMEKLATANDGLILASLVSFPKKNSGKNNQGNPQKEVKKSNFLKRPKNNPN